MATFNIIKRINTRKLVITLSFLSSQSLIKRISHKVNPVQQEKLMQRRKYKKHKRPGSTGSKHWAWRHGKCTREARQEQADTVCRLRYLCDIAIQGSFMTHTTKFMGRPPDDYLSLDLSKTEHLIYVLMKINKLI